MLRSDFRSNPCHRHGVGIAILQSFRRLLLPSAFPSLTGLAMAAAFVLASNGVVFAQTVDEKLWVTNGSVSAVVRDAATIYIGGDFTQVGPLTGGGAPLDAANGAALLSFPKVVGTVYAVISDGAGGWYPRRRFHLGGGSRPVQDRARSFGPVGFALEPERQQTGLRLGSDRLHCLCGRRLHKYWRAGAHLHRRTRCYDRGGHRLGPERNWIH